MSDSNNLQRQPGNGEISTRQQMEGLLPSAELIEHYKQKLKNIDQEFDAVFITLQSYKQTFDCQHKLESELQRSNKEIKELQSALSDMQLCLLEEKENVLKLRKENEQLKVTTGAHLKNGSCTLYQFGTYERVSCCKRSFDEIKKIDPTLTDVNQKNVSAESAKISDEKETFYLKQIQNLKNQVRSQEFLAKQQIDALRKDRLVMKEEANACCVRDADKIDALQKRLKRLQDVLHDRSAECLQLRKHVMTCSFCDPLPNVKKSPDTATRKKARIKPNGSQWQRVGQPSITSVRKSTSSCKVDKDELVKQINYFKRRCQEADLRRKLEAEGFKKDIRELRTKLGKIEALLFKISSDYFGATHDLAFLHIMTENANHAKKIAVNLRDVKSKIYSLENDLRHF